MRAILGIIFALALTVSVSAQSLLLQGATGPHPPPTTSFGGYATPVAPSSTTTTFTAVAIGAAYDDRYVYFGSRLTGASLPTITGATFGGITATQIGTDQTTGTSRFSWYVARVPTGTTANIVFTTSVNVTQACGAAHTAQGLRIPAVATGASGNVNANSPVAQPAMTSNGGALAFTWGRVVSPASFSGTNWVVQAGSTCFSQPSITAAERSPGPLTDAGTWLSTGAINANYMAFAVQ